MTWWQGLEICHVFADSIVFKQYICYSVMKVRAGGVRKLVIFCGCLKIGTYFKSDHNLTVTI